MTIVSKISSSSFKSIQEEVSNYKYVGQSGNFHGHFHKTPLIFFFFQKEQAT